MFIEEPIQTYKFVFVSIAVRDRTLKCVDHSPYKALSIIALSDVEMRPRSSPFTKQAFCLHIILQSRYSYIHLLALFVYFLKFSADQSKKADEKEYLAALVAKEVTLENFQPRPKRYKDSLQETLGSDWHVFLPNMPNAKNAKFIEWKIWFEKLLGLLEDDVVLIGHSLGGVFLASYLSREDIPKKVRATFLIAAPFGEGDFTLPSSLEKLARQAGKLFVFHSKDDPVVPFNDCEKYTEQLPNAEAVIFEDRQHFNQEQFPELVARIRSV